MEIDENNHTLRTSYELLHNEIKRLFINNWEKIKNMTLSPIPQGDKGSIHYKKDFERIRHLLGKEGWDIPIPKFKKRVEQWRRGLEINE